MPLRSRGLIPHAEAALAAAGMALAVWLLRPSLLWAVVAFGLGAFSAWSAARDQRSALALAAPLGLLGGGRAAVTAQRVSEVERHWDRVRERLITNASRQLASTLEAS